MSSLFVDRRDAHLEFDAGALVFRDSSDTQGARGARIGTVPLAPLQRIFLRGNLTLQASLLGKLGELGIGVVVLSGRLGKPGLMLGRPHHDARRRVEQTRLSLQRDFCLDFARQLVHAKLAGQQAWFAELCNQYPQARYPLAHAMHLLHEHQQRLPQARSLDSLRGLEGAAAAAYFAGLRAVVPESLNFAQRNRRPPRDPFNVLLSLTYTLVGAEVAMALHGAGLDPCIGYYHQLSWGRESLACDLLEPLRPLADRFCLQLVAQQTLTADHFSQSSSTSSSTGSSGSGSKNSRSTGCLLGKAGRVRYYSAYEENAAPLRRAIADSVEALRQTIGPHGQEAHCPDPDGGDDHGGDDGDDGDDHGGGSDAEERDEHGDSGA